MTKQTINVGIVANDKRGDPLRTAFTKANQNFTELYTLVGTIPTDVNELADSDNLLGGGGSADLGQFKISGYTLGTSDGEGGWGGGPISIDPGGESSSGIYIPSPSGQQSGGSLQIYNTTENGGPIQLLVNAGSWNFNANGSLSAPYLSVNLHNGGNQSGQVLKFGTEGQQVIITGPTPASGANAERIIIQGQRGSAGGEGGDVYIWGGDSDGESGNGGDIKIYAGDSDSNISGDGGYINLDAGNGYTSGGSLSLTAGNSRGDVDYSSGGDVNITAGNSYRDAGSVSITAGQGLGSEATNGTVNVVTNGALGTNTWTFTDEGKISGPIAYDNSYANVEIQNNLLMNKDRGFVVELGRFPYADNGDDWWFDAVVNKDGYIYAFGGNDIDGTPTIVKFDRYGEVVWQNNYTVPDVGIGTPILVSADWNSNNTLSVIGNVYSYESDKVLSIYFEVDPFDGDVTGTAPYLLYATDSTVDLPANIYSNQIRYNSNKTDYVVVGEKFGDATDLTISSASVISTTPGVLKILKSTIDSTFSNATPNVYSNSWHISGYGLSGVQQFTNVETVTVEGTEYYNLTTDSSVDFSTLPVGESWIIRYYDQGNALIMTDNWSKMFDTGVDYDWFSSVVFDATGNMYLGGGSNGPTSGNSGYTSLLISLQANGTTRWAKRIEDEDGNGWNAIQGLAIDTTNGKLFAVSRDDNQQTVIARITAATGAVDWIKTMTIDGGMSGNDSARIVYCPHDNTIVVALEYGSISSYNEDYLLMKLNTDGSLNWAQSIGSSDQDSVNWDYGQDFLSADDQYIYLSGSTYTATHDDNATVYAIPHDGVINGWVGKFNFRDATGNIDLVTGSTLGNDITGLTVSSSVSVGDDSYTTAAVSSSYPYRKVNLNGGLNKINNVAEIKFADGTTQRTSATYVPQSRILADNSVTINSNDVGGHILFAGDWGNSTVYVPLHEQDPLPIGSTVTLILDQFVNGNKVYVTGNSVEGTSVYIRPIGSDVYENGWWSVGGDDVQGLYTLMKIDNNAWILSGQTINNEGP